MQFMKKSASRLDLLNKDHRLRKILLLSLKIGVGSSLAIYLARRMALDYAVSAGTIMLLTVMTSKWESLRLAWLRLSTFLLTVVLAWACFTWIENPWIAYGVLLAAIVCITECSGWRSTISVNAVIAAHLFSSKNLDHAVWNEFWLVLIGTAIAILINLYHANSSSKKHLIANMRFVEQRLQEILLVLADYLESTPQEGSVWDEICTLEQQIQGVIQEAYEYQNNTFPLHPLYYVSYFQMRLDQCQVLHNLHYEMKKIRSMPKEAAVVSGYARYLVPYVVEFNQPQEQTRKLKQICEKFKKQGSLESGEAFESYAMLYHILMDLEEFLVYKMRFIRDLDEEQKRKYWH